MAAASTSSGGASAQRQMSTLAPQSLPALSRIAVAPSSSHTSAAIKRIHNDDDVQTWIKSKAHANLVLFVSRLCEAAVGKSTRVWEKSAVRGDGVDAIDRIGHLLDTLQAWAHEIEPLKGPQRFGNLAFRAWGQRLEDNIDRLHEELLPASLQPFSNELQTYLLGSFGSWTRLDYGSGHELSFAAWLCFLARLSYFGDEQEVASQGAATTAAPNSAEERLALEIFPKYLEVAWTLQDRYGLEPAGSHGVWGLDDYQFIPYAIGAAQLRMQTDYRPIDYASKSHKPYLSPMPPRQLLTFVPPASSAAMAGGSSALRSLGAASSLGSSSSNAPPYANLFTSSIARIHSLKRGPFSEHSPILYDVATTVPHWVKVHAGMMKMWTAECLHKRPVVQHFPFGDVGFVWEGSMRAQPPGDETSTRVPVAQPMAPTAAPWAKSTNSANTARMQPSTLPASGMAPTAAPWARGAQPGAAVQSLPSSSRGLPPPSKGP